MSATHLTMTVPTELRIAIRKSAAAHDRGMSEEIRQVLAKEYGVTLDVRVGGSETMEAAK